MLAWQLGVPPATVEVDCGGISHRVTWRRGKLVLEDHDLSAESALVGLGADPCPCLELLAAWRSACEESVPLVLPRGGGRPRLAAGRPSRLPTALDRPATLGRLVRQQRRWVRRADEAGGPREALFRRLLSEFRDAVAASLLPSRRSRAVQRIDLKVQPLEAGADPSLDIEVGRGQVRLRVELSVSWLWQVWGWELATVGHGVVVEVLGAEADGGRLAATLLRWEERSGRVMPVVGTAWLVRAADGDWSAADDPCPWRPRLWWSIDVRP
jgi:hypothetical protein